MARLNTYISDDSITGSDKVIGTDASTGVTKNYTLTGVGDWLNTAGAVRILGQANYTFQADGAAPRRPATLSLDDYLGDGISFEDITYLNFSKNPSGAYEITPYLHELVSKPIIIAHLDELQNFGIYTLVAVEEFETGFVKVTLNFDGGSGSFTDGSQYGFAPWGLNAEVPQSGVDFDPVGTDNSTDVTLDTTSHDYLSIAGQEITLGQIDYDTDITNTPTLGTASASAATDFVAVTGDTMTGGLNIEVSASNAQLKLKRTTSATGEFNIYTNTDSLYFHNVGQSTYPMMINSSGNVGIGTSSPSRKLHVSGNVRIEGDLTVNGSYTQIDTDVNTTEQWNVTNDGTGPAVTINQTGAQDIMDVQDDGTSVFYIEDGGNVGVGTTNPGANLEVAKGSEGLYLKVGGDNVSNGRGLTFSSGSNNGSVGALHTINATSGNGAISLNTAGVSRLFLDRLGNVGIGTASPLTKVHIEDSSPILTVKGTGSGEFGLKITDSSNSTAGLTYSSVTGEQRLLAAQSYVFQTLYSGGSERMRITASGNVGIGTTSPADKLHVAVSSGNYQIDGDSSGNIYHKSQSGEHRFRADGGTTNAFNIANNLVSTLKTAYFSSNVGIGTISPEWKLQIHENSGGANYIKITNDNTSEDGGNGVLIGISSSEQATFWNYEKHQYAFLLRYGTERVTITNTGNVGIGDY